MTSVDFQSRATAEGKEAQGVARRIVEAEGFKVVHQNWRHPETGVIINLVAKDAIEREWLFDVSGAVTARRNGLARTDTVYKALGRASALRCIGETRPLVFLTSKLPPAGSQGRRVLAAASSTYFDAIEMTSDEGCTRLRRYASLEHDLVALPGVRTVHDIYSNIAVSNDLGASLALPSGTVKLDLELRGPTLVGVLRHKTKVVFPSLTSEGTPIQPDLLKESFDEVRGLLSAAAGGCTTFVGEGAWLHPITGLMEERVAVIEAYSENPLPKQLVNEVVELITGPLAQHTAAIELDGLFCFFER